MTGTAWLENQSITISVNSPLSYQTSGGPPANGLAPVWIGGAKPVNHVTLAGAAKSARSMLRERSNSWARARCSVCMFVPFRGDGVSITHFGGSRLLNCPRRFLWGNFDLLIGLLCARSEENTSEL